MNHSPYSVAQTCVIGNFNIDLIIRSIPQLPLWGQEVAGDSYRQVSSGQAGYTGFALSSLGFPVSIIGYIGDDIYGQQIKNDLVSNGIDTSGIEMVAGQQTAITVAIVRPDGERAFVSDFSFQRIVNESIIQRHWDAAWRKAPLMIVLCGSVMSMMYKETLSRSSPLYGRRTGQWLLKPMRFADTLDFFKKHSSIEQIKMHALCGGVPRYAELAASDRDFSSALSRNVLARDGALYAEAKFLLQDEVTSPRSI